jgi:hypothetical protein
LIRHGPLDIPQSPLRVVTKSVARRCFTSGLNLSAIERRHRRPP